jgi:hypothetical protein
MKRASKIVAIIVGIFGIGILVDAYPVLMSSLGEDPYYVFRRCSGHLISLIIAIGAFFGIWTSYSDTPQRVGLFKKTIGFIYVVFGSILLAWTLYNFFIFTTEAARKTSPFPSLVLSTVLLFFGLKRFLHKNINYTNENQA